MTKKRYRTPKLYDDEIRIQWGKEKGRYETPELMYYWGRGIPKQDVNLLVNCIDTERYSYNSDTPNKSLIKELELRGYDIETLKISIQKKETNK